MHVLSSLEQVNTFNDSGCWRVNMANKRSGRTKGIGFQIIGKIFKPSRKHNGKKTRRTRKENNLLRGMKAGKLDGLIGDTFYPRDSKSTFWSEVKNGVPTRFKRGPDRKYFDGKENIRKQGVLRSTKKWKTDDEKLDFMKKYGWLSSDKKAKAYSKQFKPKK